MAEIRPESEEIVRKQSRTTQLENDGHDAALADFRSQRMPRVVRSAVRWFLVPERAGPTSLYGVDFESAVGATRGPCHRCGEYFVKKVRRQKAVYCCRSCGAASTALVCVRGERKRVREEKIAVAQREINKLSSNSRRGDWKEAVAKRTGYNLRWITRSINNKSLRPPSNLKFGVPAR
jgi:predicted RNA-binding Zn-ribbon protein involved in translation (DUF1610 family)